MSKNLSTQQVVNATDEVSFWQTHQPGRHSLPLVNNTKFLSLKPSTKTITIRVPEHLLTNLKLIANKRDVPYQSLLKHFLQEKVDQELQTPFLKLRRRGVKTTTRFIAALLVSFGVTYAYVVQPIKAQGNSMAPALPNNTYYLLDKLSIKLRAPQRNEIVVFNSPSLANTWFVKRVVGMPGDRLALVKNHLVVNGQSVALIDTDLSVSFPQNEVEITVPGNSYYVLGDNVDESTDSRSFGFVTKENIIGVVGTCYWNCQ